jgi:hypothetical protein
MQLAASDDNASFGMLPHEYSDKITVSEIDSPDALENYCDDAKEAYDFYYTNVEEADFGCVRLFRLKELGVDTDVILIRVTTDGDDGWIEAYDSTHRLAAGRTYLELVHWMDNNIEGLRLFTTDLSNMFPDDFDTSKTKWGTPLPWD